MTAVKSGNHIYIEGTGNTLESIYNDINDDTFCTWESATNVFTVIGLAAIRYFRVRSGGSIEVSGGESLMFYNPTDSDTRFYVDLGGEFIMSGNSLLDGRDPTGARPYYWYWYGKITIIGPSTTDMSLNPKIQGFRRVYSYETANNDNNPDENIHIENATIGSNGYAANNYFLYFVVNGKIKNHIFRNVELDDSTGYNFDTYALAFVSGAGWGSENILIENCKHTSGERFIQNSDGRALRMKGNTYDGGSASWSVLHYNQPTLRGRDTYNNHGYGVVRPYGQAFAFHENDTWTALGSNLCVLVSYGAEVLFKDCTWLETSGDAIECKYQGRSMIWTGNTFTDSVWYDVASNGEISFVFGCGVTVNDLNGNPIEDATVQFRQKELKEEFFFRTKDNGKLHSMHSLELAFLTYQSRWGNSTNNVETWSDGSGDQYHEVIVSVPGYQTQIQSVIMDQDRELIFTMSPEYIENFSQSDIIKL